MSKGIKFFERFTLKIQGDEGLAKWISDYYERLPSAGESESADLVFSNLLSLPTVEYQKGDPKRYYGFGDGWFIRKERNNCIAINEDWTHIKASPGMSPWHLIDLIEYPIRRQMADDGFVMAHGSSVIVNDTTFVFPAWRHTGKTNTILTLLQEHRGQYLSDDRVFINSDGEVYGYPLKVNMYPYNFSAFPNLSPFSRTEELRSQTSSKISNLIKFDRSLVDKMLKFTNDYLIDPDLKKLMHMDEIFPSTSFAETASLDELVFLQTKPGLAVNDINKKTYNSTAAMSDFVAINTREWNNMLQEWCSVHESFVETQNTFQQYNDFVTKEKKLIKDITNSCPTLRLVLPQEENWYNENVGPKLREVVLNE